MIDSLKLSEALTDQFGLEIDTSITYITNGQKIIIKPTEIEESKSFRLEFILGWRSISARYLPGNFAHSFVYSMSQASEEQKKVFSVFATSLISKGATIEMKINNQYVDYSNYTLWPSYWKNVSIEMKKVGVLIENNTEYDFNVAYPWTTGFFGLIMSLLPLEEVPVNYVGEKEGALEYKSVKVYERSKINRAACIEIHGTSCKICKMNFKEVYGDLGEGFIHVHHITPLSSIGKEYVLDPGKDLIPVCPNCHSMLHRRNPVLHVEELEKMINK